MVFEKSLRPSALDESGLSIGRAKHFASLCEKVTFVSIIDTSYSLGDFQAGMGLG